MKILIDARLYGLENAGIGRYTVNLIEKLSQIDTDNRYIVFLRKKYFREIKLPSGWEKVLVDIPHYSLLEQLQLPTLISKFKPDLVHFLHLNAPALYLGNFVITIHDLLWHQVRGRKVTTLPAGIYLAKYLGYRFVVRNLISHSVKIITPTRFVKEDLIKRFNLRDDKIKTIYEGVSSLPKATEIFARQTLRKYSIKPPYILYVGNLYPHKNIGTLIKSLKILRGSLPGIKLIVVCSRDVFWDKFREFLVYQNAEDLADCIGFVTDKELSVLYNQAELFVYPTLFEGFGLPGLEAMACGCPVVCSDIPVLREIYGKAAIYFNGKKPEDIAEKIKKVLSNSQLRKKLIIYGNEQIKRYSWLKMAKETLEVYRHVCR